MQAKDIPVMPVLKFLRDWANSNPSEYGTWGSLLVRHSGEPFPNCVLRGMPAGVPFKVARAKMASLVRQGLVDGCTCGCRGDFELTVKGQAYLAADTAKPGESNAS